MAILIPIINGQLSDMQQLDQIIYELQRQSGSTENGSYWFEFGTFETGANAGVYLPSRSKNTTPISVSFDTSITTATGFTAVSTAALDSNGFWIGAAGVGPSNTARVGGHYSIQY